MKRTERDRRNEALAHARDYARVRKYDMTRVWLERAVRCYPLTEIQLWSIKSIIGEYKFEELGFGNFPVER